MSSGLFQVMANGIRTGDPRGFNKGRSSKFREGFRVRQTPEEDWKTYWPKRSGNSNKDEDNSQKTLIDKNQQASSQKFKQLIFCFMYVRKNTTIFFFKVYSVTLPFVDLLIFDFLNNIVFCNILWYITLTSPHQWFQKWWLHQLICKLT